MGLLQPTPAHWKGLLACGFARKALVFCAVLFSIWIAVFFLLSLPYGRKGAVVEIRVERGEPFASIARKLTEAGAIPNTILFRLWARAGGMDRKIGWGRYRLELPLAPREVLDRLVLGKGAYHRVTVPEGLTVKEIGSLLENYGLITQKRFMEQARSPEFLSALGLDGNGAEGYLFPDTYHFGPSTTEAEILRTMLGQFQRVFTDSMEARARELGFSRHEIVTLASVIEKEAGIEEERPLVSAVFHNRLKRGMPLQSDPTVIYGIPDFSGNLTRVHLQTMTPYNTYLRSGLPPGPICNPGLSSLQAALYPASAPYLYFVSKNDGSHFFSKTLREHNRAVQTYQMGKSQPKRP